MVASLAVSLDLALRDVRTVAADLGGLTDPFRLELPPDEVEDARLEPRTAAVLGSLYLLSELEQVDVVVSAELLARERYGLGIHDPAAAAGLEKYAGRLADRPGVAARHQLYGRLFGAHWADEPVPGTGTTRPVPENGVFEELLAGYCDAIADFDQVPGRRGASVLRATGDRLRANLAPRQFGNTMLVAGRLLEQTRDSLDLLALPGIGQLVAAQGVWGVVRALHGDDTQDIGRHLDRGQTGRVVVGSCGYPPVADLVDAPLRQAAETWLVATGFSAPAIGALPV